MGEFPLPAIVVGIKNGIPLFILLAPTAGRPCSALSAATAAASFPLFELLLFPWMVA